MYIRPPSWPEGIASSAFGPLQLNLAIQQGIAFARCPLQTAPVFNIDFPASISINPAVRRAQAASVTLALRARASQKEGRALMVERCRRRGRDHQQPFRQTFFDIVQAITGGSERGLQYQFLYESLHQSGKGWTVV